jgi:RNA polymerase sigma-70 factor (ECF subfamily)
MNAVRTARRREGRTARLDDGLLVPAASTRADPDLRERLARAIDGLPAGYRAVFVMHDVEGYTHEQIGATLGIASGTSKAQLFHARAKLRAQLADFREEWAS